MKHQDNVCELEKLYFSLFPTTSAESFRKLLLFVVYSTIKNNDGITLNKLQWSLNSDFSFEETDVDITVNALSNKRIFGAISKFHINRRKGKQDSRDVVHLRLRKDNSNVIDSWIVKMLTEHPEYSTMCS